MTDLTQQLLEAAAYSEGRGNYLAAESIRSLLPAPSPSPAPAPDFFSLINYTPSHIQARFHAGNYSVFHLHPGRGAGKTTAILAEAGRFAYSNPYARVLLIFDTDEQASYAFAAACTMYNPLSHAFYKRNGQSIDFVPSHGDIIFTSVHRVNAGRHRGQRFHLAFHDRNGTAVVAHERIDPCMRTDIDDTVPVKGFFEV